MNISNQNLLDSLRNNFRLRDFRNGQQEIIESIFGGSDTLVVMPTGGGKSLCFQLPALLLEGVALVISPLIALMKDQVDALQKINIPATFINSSLTLQEIRERIDKSRREEYKLMYIAPERLDSSMFLDLLREMRISFLAVDEAHCISEWGHDFRPAYLSIIKAFESVKRMPIIALTATATPDVQDDIVKALEMKNAQRFIRGFDRPNLSYITERTTRKTERIIEICKKTRSGSTIIYCGTRKQVEEYAADVVAAGIKVSSYHAGMKDDVRKSEQEKFISGENKIIFATNAFGMGIDKPDVRNVVHSCFTQSLEAYYQEAGRAGRDGLPANCIMLFQSSDRRLQEFFISTNYPEIEEIGRVYNELFELSSTPIGKKSSKAINIELTILANRLNLPIYTVNSVINLFDRNGIIRRSAESGFCTVQFTTSKERIIEYYNNTSVGRRSVLEALLRSVSQNTFEREEELDLNHFLRKYFITQQEFVENMRAFEHGRLLKYSLPAGNGGIILLEERVDHPKKLPIDYAALEKRKKHAYAKLDMVIDYAETDDCKRNYILDYFQDKSYKDVCGRCSGCKYPKRKTERSRSSRRFFNLIPQMKEGKQVYNNTKQFTPKQTTLPADTLKIAELARKGMTLALIAGKTGLKEPEIAMHLQTAIESGASFDINLFVHKGIYNKIVEFMKKRPYAPLREVRACINTDIGLSSLRVALALARRELGIKIYKKN